MVSKWLDWLVKIRDPRDCWKSQPTYLISELTYLTIGLLTFIHCELYLTLVNFLLVFNFYQELSHSIFLICCFCCRNFLIARRVGGRFKYLWLATIFHGLTVECAAYWLPDIDNFWHSQTTIVLLGRRLPIHIMMLCNTYMH